jgi:hypothetical protein
VSFAGTENLDRWTERMSTLLTQFASGKDLAIRIVQ